MKTNADGGPETSAPTPSKRSGASTHQEHTDSRGSLWLLWGSIGMTVLGLLGGFYALQVRVQGDYLGTIGNTMQVIRFESSPFPQVTHLAFGATPTAEARPYVAGLGNIYILDDDSLTRLTATFSLERDDAVLPYYRLVPAKGSGPHELAVEWFPTYSLDAFFAATTSEGRARAARDLVDRFPDRPTPRYWMLASLFESGEIQEAETLLARWENDFRADPTWRGEHYLRLLHKDRRAAETGTAARMADVSRHMHFDVASHYATVGLHDTIAWLQEHGAEPLPYTFSFVSNVPNFLSVQIRAKLARAWAMFLAASGDREGAHRLLQGIYVASAMTANPGTLIQELIAMATKSITVAAMADLYVHGSVEYEELRSYWEDLEATWPLRPEYDELQMLRTEMPWLSSLSALPPGPGSESLIRYRVAEIRRQLLRAAMRARAHRLTEESWPLDPAEWARAEELLPSEEAAGDLFGGTGAPAPPLLHEARAGQNGPLHLWSVGPDKIDDRAALEYDPTNGTVSPGDIILELQTTPKYDWPREPGYTYANREEFDRRYPSGLPLDPFSSYTRGATLRLSTETPLRIWSWGPDTDEPPHPPYRETPEVLYDPTNGATSDGDLWMELPVRE